MSAKCNGEGQNLNVHTVSPAMWYRYHNSKNVVWRASCWSTMLMGQGPHDHIQPAHTLHTLQHIGGW